MQTFLGILKSLIKNTNIIITIHLLHFIDLEKTLKFLYIKLHTYIYLQTTIISLFSL